MNAQEEAARDAHKSEEKGHRIAVYFGSGVGFLKRNEIYAFP